MARTVKTIIEDDKKKLDAPEAETVSGEGDDAPEIENSDTPEKEPPAKSTEDEAAELRKQLAAEREATRAERARADEAEARAGTAKAQARTAFEQQIQGKESELDTKIANAKTTLESIKQQLKTARVAGDSDAEIELQDAMTDARYGLNAVVWEKKNFETWKAAQLKEAEKKADPETSSPYTTKERAWIRNHPEFNTNKKFARLAKIAAQEARDEGHEQDTPGYFSFIEDALAEANLLTKGEDPLSGAGTNTRSSVSVALPPQNDVSSKTVTGANPKYPFIPRNFRIPADWVEAAENQGFDDVREYANMRLEEESKGSPR